MKNAAPARTAIAASLSLAATASLAATWTGTNGTDLADPLNWSGDVHSTEMKFNGNASLTLGSDTDVFRVFGSSGNNRNVTIDLSGHNLGTTSTESSNRDFWRATGTTIMITNSSATAASFTQKSTLVLDLPGYTGTRLVVSGEKTAMNGSIQNRGGVRCRLDVLDGATLSGSYFMLAQNYLTNNVANGATLSASTTVSVGSPETGKPHDNNNGPWHGNFMSVSDATLSANQLIVGCGQVSGKGAPYDNAFRADGGATVTLRDGAYVGCGAAATNNSAVVTGAGTTLSATNLRVGTRTTAADGTISATMPATNNVFAAEDGATVSAKNIYIGAGGNALVVCSGATVEGTAGGSIQLTMDMTTDTIANAGGRIGSRVEIVGGTLRYLNRFDVGSAQEVFVGEGGTLGEKALCFGGTEARLVVSNGTVDVSDLQMRNRDYNTGSNNTVRIMGENAQVLALNVNFANAAAKFEFVLPANGWSEAPFRCRENFTMPADFTLRLDAASVRAYKAGLNARGRSKGTVPLMQAGFNSVKTITIADATALSENLPPGCTLKNSNGVLSAEIAANAPTVLSVR